MPLPASQSQHGNKSKSKSKPTSSERSIGKGSKSSTVSIKEKKSTGSDGRMSAQTLNYIDDDGVIVELDIEETTLDTDGLYEHLYEDLIDNEEGITASRLCSKDDVMIQFQESSADTICPICRINLQDCPHSPTHNQAQIVNQQVTAEQITKRLNSNAKTLSRSTSNTSVKSNRGKATHRKS